ncbi:hypothetical protein F5X99DRAFT_393975 [Biscogniauxia marginata]|nr:hypothetical protein F5X99DRAFT_393975 [Biscogniauxia marginata]
MPLDFEDRTDGERDSEDEDDDDEEDGFYTEQDSDINHKRQRFAAARKAIRAREGNFSKSEDLRDFVDEYRDVIGQAIEDSGTLLHIIVELVKHTPEMKSGRIKPLVQHIVREYPDLLRYPNDMGQNALYMAIWNKKWMLVDYMLRSCPVSSRGILADALTDPCTRESNKSCLHLAFEKDLRAETIEKLIFYASDKALGAIDTNSKTPLHYAVNYGQCTENRVKVIEILISRDKEAVAKLSETNLHEPIFTFLDYVDKHGRSVYREHQSSAAVYTAALVKRSKAKAEEGTGTKRLDNLGNEDAATIQPVNNASTSLQVNPDPKYSERPKDTKYQPGRERERERDRKQDNDRERGKQGYEKVDERERARQEAKRREALALEGGRRTRDQDRDSEARDVRRDESMRPKGPINAIKGGGPLSSIQTSNGGHTRVDPSPNTPIKRVSTIKMDDEDKPKKKVPEKPVKKSDKSDPITLARNSEKILLSLKLHYMRTRNTEMAVSFLYGKNIEGVQICFDYHGLPEEVKDEVFTNSFGTDCKSGIQFDKVLQYVSFPKVNVVRPARRAARDPPGGLGRRDMQFFFDWLYRKGVRHIIKATVDDTAKLVHCDDAIQKCLENFVVEHLDWQKVDMDPQIICRVASKVNEKSATKEDTEGAEEIPNPLTEITLRWSGNNAVLRAWSELEGLPLLPKLRKIHLHIPEATETYDSREWISHTVREFQVRLNNNVKARRITNITHEASSEENNAPKNPGKEKSTNSHADSSDKNLVEVFQIKSNTSKGHKVTTKDPSQTASSASQVITSHQWLDCMDKFADHIRPFWSDTRKAFLDSRPERARETDSGVEKDVIVALIDDGVDSCDLSFSSGQILDGKTFDYENGRIRPHFVSARGHGTVMANMITRVCPMAKIYPIRLKTRSLPDGKKTEIVAESAAHAIQAALDKGATIISMSWTVPIPDDSHGEEKELFKKVLQKACDRKILMFCSSPDSGKFTEKDYPTAFHRESFFRIGAAKGDGTVYSWAGSTDYLNFILPGVDVVKRHMSERTRHLTDKVLEIPSETGSSVATALAAGLAATIIYCVKASALAVATFNARKGTDENDLLGAAITSSEARKISEHDTMKAAFQKIGHITEDRFIQVWESFEPANQVFDDPNTTDKQRAESIIALSSNLIRR